MTQPVFEYDFTEEQLLAMRRCVRRHERLRRLLTQANKGRTTEEAAAAINDQYKGLFDGITQQLNKSMLAFERLGIDGAKYSSFCRSWQVVEKEQALSEKSANRCKRWYRFVQSTREDYDAEFECEHTQDGLCPPRCKHQEYVSEARELDWLHGQEFTDDE